MYNHTVARLTCKALLGRRRALLLCALPLLLVAVAFAVRVLGDVDDDITKQLLGGFAMATIVPLIGVVAGTGAIGPEIDDGSVVYLLAKPVPRSSIVLTKLLVAIGVTVAFTAIPTFAAGYLLNGDSQQIASAYAVAAAAASVAYSALFLLLGTLSRHAVVIGLVYALIWEALFGNLVPGARDLSVQQWALTLAEKVGASSAGITSEVTMTTGVSALAAVTVVAVWYASRRLSGFTFAGEE